ncbi:heme ABC transporter substrate-binding protein IsdE [Peribacillus loiseleuriae]|uniref:High-affinity heme uptake system protein IsdE n=1 Tax=Peribacillus loiseleuriae TaxID=1679170 RepID=A0A0K9GXU9_9BACI|nr:heme ABC transporter substrate-binding protein IsdE [Peribacillus loiseleuriae]KMY51465.1 heme ABC transporter substrate-binding protein [Peribacillus loiseleuriae]
MNKGIMKAFLCCVILLLLITGCSSEQETIQTDNQSENENRIVSSTVAITEIMDALELDLVGIPDSSKELPKRYDGVSNVGFVKNPDLEIIKSLHPTEVLTVSTLEYDLKPIYENAGIEATFLNLDSLEKMQQTILSLGEQYDRNKQAEKIVTKMDDKVAEIHKAVEGKEKPTVLILLGIPGSYLVASEHSYIGDIARLCGAVNVVTGEKVEYVATNTEFLQQTNPDIILRAAHGVPDEVVKMFDKEFKENDIWKHFDAVKNGRVFDLEEEIYGTTGNLAATEALDEMMKMLYQ